jgi:DNA-binding CsgD family transcriptional regulator
MSESLPALSAALRTASESTALETLGRFLDAVPIPVVVTDCSPELRFVYGNVAWYARLAPAGLPQAAQPLRRILPALEESPLLAILRRICETGEPATYRCFPNPSPVNTRLSRPGSVSMWDWEAFLLRDTQGRPGHLLIMAVDVTERYLADEKAMAAGRPPSEMERDPASGILRLFRMSEAASTVPPEGLSRRENEVADLIACGLSNPAIARELCISPATVSSHVNRMLQKLGFTSRTQVAAWVIEQRLLPQHDRKAGRP